MSCFTPGSSLVDAAANTLSTETMAELATVLAQIETRPLTGLVVYSGKRSGFIAGADLGVIGLGVMNVLERITNNSPSDYALNGVSTRMGNHFSAGMWSSVDPGIFGSSFMRRSLADLIRQRVCN